MSDKTYFAMACFLVGYHLRSALTHAPNPNPGVTPLWLNMAFVAGGVLCIVVTWKNAQ